MLLFSGKSDDATLHVRMNYLYEILQKFMECNSINSVKFMECDSINFDKSGKNSYISHVKIYGGEP